MNINTLLRQIIAARGIDIDGVSHVINMQFPTEPDFYIHRKWDVSTGSGNYTGYLL